MTSDVQLINYAIGARRDSDRDGLDFFPTPPWATRALCEWIADRQPIHLLTAWEPACGKGHMARPLAEYFGNVLASDVHDYGYGGVQDFLEAGTASHDWIITNPPFNLADRFAEKAQCANNTALLVRTSFLEGQARFANLFSKRPPTDILQFTERVPMHKGRLLKNGSTATAYCWVVWRDAQKDQTRFHWIAPCRKRLERERDYWEPSL